MQRNPGRGAIRLEDGKILELFWARDQEAVREVQRKYGSKLRSLAQRLLFSPEDAEECVSDACLIAWQTIPPQRPAHLGAYLAKLCRCSAFDRLDRKNARKRTAEVVELTAELELCIPDPTAQVGESELGAALNTFLETLGKEKRRIFLRRYWYGDSVREVARRYGLGESKVKMSLLRTRNELRTFLSKEGFTL